ncbi:MAG TPA: transglutaminase family protein, partial [Tepidisphaeraceae bacterium]|nr:transglutaminase family protein [Tepidisphaeraceae bacterium]
MLLNIRHTTDLSYSDLISESVMELRVCPRQEQDQHRLSFHLAIGPAANVSGHFDWLGNTVHAFAINSFHKEIRIVATSVVETDRQKVEPQRFADTWPVRVADDYTLYDYVHFGGPVVDAAALRGLVDIVAPEPGESLGEIALRVLHLIDDKFNYKTGITTFASPITDMLDAGAGVCQDFTHLMIAGLRALGLPARYCSGYIRTRPPPGGRRRQGADQSHAWVGCWMGPELG